MKKKILVIDDDVSLCEMLSMLLTNAGYQVKSLNCARNTIREVTENPPDVILLDVCLPESDGRQLLKELKKFDKNLTVIMMTGSGGGTKNIVDAIKEGAFDYIDKPFVNEELLLTIKRALESRALYKEISHLRSELARKNVVGKMLGESPEFQRMLSKVRTVAQTNLTIVLQGESGVGKELVADMIHRASQRKDKPYIPVDCGAIPENLVESELFGHKKGAFTGASADRKGKFEQADGGTLFLDEVTNLSETAQSKLLRVLEDKKVWCLGGGSKAVAVDVRIIAASNVDLATAVKQNKFREDLFHRLNEFSILIPPLRARKEDITGIANHFIKNANKEFNKEMSGISQDALKLLLNYAWPGNVRELKNVINMAVLTAESKHINIADLPPSIAMQKNDHVPAGALDSGTPLEHLVGDFERKLIKDALLQTGGSKVRAATILQIDRKCLYRKMDKLGIT